MPAERPSEAAAGEAERAASRDAPETTPPRTTHIQGSHVASTQNNLGDLSYRLKQARIRRRLARGS